MKKILIVEDDPDLLALARYNLLMCVSSGCAGNSKLSLQIRHSLVQ